MADARERLWLWKDRLNACASAYEEQRGKMDMRERLYLGTKEIRPAEGEGGAKPASHVRNVVSELIEAQVNSAIPQPKVTARRKEDEGLARIIEDMLRNELDRLPFEQMNDMQERTCLIQGGTVFLVNWDNGVVSGKSYGDVCVSDIHPKCVVPQEGMTADIEDMDYIFLQIPQTKQYIQRRYGVSVLWEEEEEPELKSAAGAIAAEELVTQNIAYFRNDDGGIGIFSWVGDTVLDDMESYQSRKVKLCESCGAVAQTEKCRVCSGGVRESIQEEETLYKDILRSDGSVIPAVSRYVDEQGREAVRRTKIPYYVPDIFPLVLRKNVSVFGQFLGDSDVDKIADQQNTIKKLSTKILEKLLKGGSYVTLPGGVNIDKSDRELKIINLKNPADKAMIDVINIQPNISGDMAMLHQTYEEARQMVGITDSFQGRADKTATSGVAKEFAAQQSAGRLESKKVQKQAAYARLFEVMFKFKLAYTDEPRSVVSTDNRGNRKYETFNRYDFLRQDEYGKWYWNDQFLFACDTAAALATNREALWQEARLNFQQGAYGPVNMPETLALFWARMEQLSYPGAGDTKKYFEAKAGREDEMSEMQS